MINHYQVKKWNQARIGLVLAGGGAKGAYEAGALAALSDLHIAEKITAVSGTSVGALNAVAFACGRQELCGNLWKDISLKDVLNRNEKQDRKKLSQLIRAFLSDNLNIRSLDNILRHVSKTEQTPFTQQGLRRIFKKEIHCDRLRAGNMQVYACAYDIQAGKPAYFHLNEMENGEMEDAVMASAAIPYLFRPVLIQGKPYADGGINDPTYPSENSDNTPILPLYREELDAIIIIHLRADATPVLPNIHMQHILNLIPSRPLETMKWAGTMNFSRQSVQEKRQLGYRDAICTLAPWIMDFLNK